MKVDGKLTCISLSISCYIFWLFTKIFFKWQHILPNMLLQLTLIDFWKTYQHLLKTTAPSVFHLYWPPSLTVVYKNILLSSSQHCLTSCLITLSSSDSLLVFHRYFRVKFIQYLSQCIIWSQQGAISNKSCPVLKYFPTPTFGSLKTWGSLTCYHCEL